MEIYYCQDQAISDAVGADRDAWLSERHQPDLQVCRLATAQEVEEIGSSYAAWVQKLNGELLELADGSFRAEAIQSAVTRGDRVLSRRSVEVLRLHQI